MTDSMINFDAHITGHWGEDYFEEFKPLATCHKCGKTLYHGDYLWKTPDGDFCEECAIDLYRVELEEE